MMVRAVAARRFRGRGGAWPPVARWALNGRLAGLCPAPAVGSVGVAVAAAVEANRPLAKRGAVVICVGRRVRDVDGVGAGRSKSLSMSDADASLME